MFTNVLVSMFLAAGLPLQTPTPAASAPATVAAPAAASASASQTPDASPGEKRAAPETYVIGPNDTIDVTVFDNPDLTNKYRVDESGMVSFPLIGRIQAGGKKITQFQDDLTKRLSGDYIKNPQVRVDISTYKSQAVTVSGAVRQAQRVAMSGQLTLLDALVQAGSLTSDASDDIQIAHSPSSPGDEPVHVSFKSLQLGRNNIALQDGDLVFVPPAQHFTMTGQVKQSGQYVWEDGLTVEQAIARAGGLTDRGSNRKIKAHRMVSGKMKDVDLKESDKVQAGDTITIGQRTF